MPLGRRAITGTFWVAGGTYANFVINFVTMIWLMRLVAPELFGVFALGFFFMGLTKRLFGFGFNHSLIHRQEEVERAAATHLSMHLIASVGTLLVLGAVYPLLSAAYGPQIAAVALALAAFALLEDGSHTPRILLEKRLAFSRTMVLNTSATLSASVGSIILAYAGYGLEAIVARYAINVGVGFVGYWVLTPLKVRPRLDREMAIWFVRFGGYLWVGGMATYVILELDDLLVGTLVGSLALGYYNRAYRLSCLPTDVIGHVVARVAFPLYAQLQADRERLSRAVHLILRVIFVTSLPASLWLVLVAPQFTLILLGEKWLPTVPLLRLLLVYSAMRPIFATSGELFVAVGQPKIQGHIILAQAVLLAILCPPATHWFQAAGAAVSVSLVMAFGVVAAYWRARAFVDVSYASIFVVPVAAAAAGAAAALAGGGAVSDASTGTQLLIRSAAFLFTYVFVLIPLQGRTLFAELRYLVARFRSA